VIKTPTLPSAASTTAGDPLAPILVDRPEAARLLGISVRLLDSLTKDKKIPHVRLSGRVMYSPEKMRQWVNAQAQGGEQ
jgi:hypothetical protein